MLGSVTPLQSNMGPQLSNDYPNGNIPVSEPVSVDLMQLHLSDIYIYLVPGRIAICPIPKGRGG